MQLAPAPRLGLAINEHLIRREQDSGIGTRVDNACELQQRPQADHVAADVNVLGHRGNSVVGYPPAREP